MRRIGTRTFAWVALFFCLAALGCESNHYELALVPREDRVERQLVCWRQTPGNKSVLKTFSADELARLTKIYGLENPPAGEDWKYRFTGQFAGTLPQDIGGAGRYVRWSTQLGSAAIYSERFRGNDDLAAVVERRMRLADQGASFLVAWFSAELKGDPRWPKLRKLMDEDLRRDMRNLVVYSFVADAVSQEKKGNAEAHFTVLAARYGQYLLERNYFSPDELPAITSRLSTGQQPDWLTISRGILARRLGLSTKDADEMLKFLTDDAAVEASIAKFSASGEPYRSLVDEAVRLMRVPPEKLSSDKKSNLIEFVLVGTGLPMLRADDSLKSTLVCGAEPVASNGSWDKKNQQVVWSNDLPPNVEQPYDSIPVLHYAMWAEPDTTFQTKVFGKVLLDAGPLAQYCLWRQSLPAEEAREWDAFVARLKPSDDAALAFGEFRFSQERVTPPQHGAQLSEMPRRLISEAMGKN